MNDAVSTLIEKLEGRTPKVALVLGSGLGGLVDDVENAIHIPMAACRAFRIRA
jgi:purine-nucleoside phosphorylase